VFFYLYTTYNFHQTARCTRAGTTLMIGRYSNTHVRHLLGMGSHLVLPPHRSSLNRLRFHFHVALCHSPEDVRSRNMPLCERPQCNQYLPGHFLANGLDCSATRSLLGGACHTLLPCYLHVCTSRLHPHNAFAVQSKLRKSSQKKRSFYNYHEVVEPVP
jgi:hypothetical protein